jgi:gamma-tubulin complex component 2
VYITILSKWLYEGIIEDKFNEFMIKTEEKSQNKEWSYWEEKFMIREDMVPSIFAKEANQILVIGKYLNILKACKKMGENPYKKDIETNLQKYISLQNFSEPILKAHEWTNSKMLELVFNDCKL